MKLTLLLLALTAVTAYADNRNPADQAARFARESRQEPANGTSNATDVQYVTASNGKGGTVVVAQRDQSTASIALTKSGSSCNSGSCSSCSR
jgi:hypothetical protein